jgi:hypothetical protein
MSEDLKKPDGEVVGDTKVEEVELSPVELEASEQGWVPKEQWVEAGNDPEEWRTAKEFRDRGVLYKDLHGTKRDLKQTQATLTALQKHHKYVFEKAHRAAVADLKREKRAAMANEEFDRVEAIDEEIEQANTEFQTAATQLDAAAPVNAGPHPDFQAWISMNPWYERDADLREEADAVGMVYFNKNTSTPPQQVLKHVAEVMRKRHPDKFGQKKVAPNPTAAVNRTQTKGREVDIELDAMEREIMNTLVKGGTMTEKQYKDELKKVKGL